MSNVKKLKNFEFFEFKNLSKRNKVRKEIGIHYRIFFVKNWSYSNRGSDVRDYQKLPVMNFYKFRYAQDLSMLQPKSRAFRVFQGSIT